MRRIFLIVAPVALLLFAIGLTSSSDRSKNDILPLKTTNGPHVRIRGQVIPVEIATTTEAVSRGLSGRSSLAADSGMLFIFEKPDRYRFWMPNMQFPLDIIWIENERVLDITPHVSNDFDPASPRFYSPSVPVRYVLEVNAGFAERSGIEVGDSIEFSL